MGFVYASAHVHDVDGQTDIQDGGTPVGIDAGFEVAPGDAGDVEVANAHAWGSVFLLFSDGARASSALDIAWEPSHIGIIYSELFSQPVKSCSLMMISGARWDSDDLAVDSSRRVSATYDDHDVLLRTRA